MYVSGFSFHELQQIREIIVRVSLIHILFYD